MVFFAMASVGLPGLNGFVSEVLCLVGTFGPTIPGAAPMWRVPGPARAVVRRRRGHGHDHRAIYLLFMVGKVVWGPLVLPGGAKHGGGGHADQGAWPLIW